MLIIDYVLLFILGYFTLWGFRKGLIRAVGGMVGLVVAVVLASRYFETVGDSIAPYIGMQNNLNLARMISFVGLLFVINYGVSISVSIVEKMYKTVAILPFMKLGNRLLGALLGLVQASVSIGLILYFAARFPFGSIVEKFFEGSHVAPIVMQIANVVHPLLPDVITKLEGLI